MTTYPIENPSAAYELAPDQLLFTPVEAANVLRIGRTKVHELMGNGQLNSVYIGRCRRVSRGELERYVARLCEPIVTSPSTSR